MARKLQSVTQAQDNTMIPSMSSCKTTSLKIGELKVNIRSSFYPDKSLYDALFAITSMRLKENSV